MDLLFSAFSFSAEIGPRPLYETKAIVRKTCSGVRRSSCSWNSGVLPEASDISFLGLVQGRERHRTGTGAWVLLPNSVEFLI